MKALMTEPSWQKDMMLAAIKQLEANYSIRQIACIALQISRTYRLLASQFEENECRSQWQFLARLWWQRYSIRRRQTASNFTFSEFPQQIQGASYGK